MTRQNKPSASLLAWSWGAQLRSQPARFALACLSVAIGVGLAAAIQLVNTSALAEFDAALAVVNGQAQARIESRSGSFDETLWPQLAALDEFEATSPVLEASRRVRKVAVNAADAAVAPAVPAAMNARAANPPVTLRILGLDPMRAAAVQPELMPTTSGGGAADLLFADDSIFLSSRALQQLDVSVGDRIRIGDGDGDGTSVPELTIAGVLERVPGDVSLAVMDIGTMQWQLGLTGRLSRIDLRLADGVPVTGLQQRIDHALPPGLLVTGPESQRARMSNLSRAYRVNLGVLALVALFTGGFIVHATTALAVVRVQRQLALLAVLGAPRRYVLTHALGMPALAGGIGAVLGCAAGVAGAWILLATIGGDLGGGYFSGSQARLHVDPETLAVLALAGFATALFAGWGPARRAAQRAGSRALAAGAEEAVMANPAHPLFLGLLVVIAAALLAAPPIASLPIGAYAAIAIGLLAGVLVLAPAMRRLLPRLASDRFASIGIAPWLAVQRVAATPSSTAAALGGVVASVALACAMAVMVTSFRTSVSQWLEVVLPADLHGQMPSAGSGPVLDEPMRERIERLPGLRHVEFLQGAELLLAPERPPVAILVREIDAQRPQDRLPLTGASARAPDGIVPVWISEAVADVYGWRPGSMVTLPLASLADAAQPPDQRVFVAGIWRDYARQHGAVVLSTRDWLKIAGFLKADSLAIWLEEGTQAQHFIERLHDQVPELAALRLRSAQELRAISLRIFDRSFAVTWALEAVAAFVALTGTAAGWSAEALARRREFGLLRHLGVRAAAIRRQLVLEAATLVAIAAGWGLALGAAIAVVLVHRVNPQSFHWTMDLHWPLVPMIAGYLTLIALAAIVAALAVGPALREAPTRAMGDTG